ncbi:MAG: polyprenyl synthetase family protein [Chloroflexota bacterium]|nr:polyprenyl synthetase family protein [Chloroflexota bacterium]
MNIQTKFSHYLQAIEKELKAILGTPHELLAPFYGMMHYHLGWVDEHFVAREVYKGKRLRPLFCLLTCEAAGGDFSQALPAAAAVEIVHNFSLIHDDIEDNSPTRRHRTTVWKLWGIPHGINAGDGLFAHAYLTLSHLVERGVSHARALAAQRALVEACLMLCEGQYLDMTFETRQEVGLDEYLWMIRNKTATLLACSCQLGAMVASDDSTLIAHYYRFAENLGMTFQVQDDILGIWGQKEVTGKSAISDILQRKKTLPFVYAVSVAGQEEASRRLKEIYGRPVIDERAVNEVLDILDSVGAREYATEVGAEYHSLALKELEATNVDNEAHASLRQLADSLLGRTS